VPRHLPRFLGAQLHHETPGVMCPGEDQEQVA
jgi:hypothetical protein